MPMAFVQHNHTAPLIETLLKPNRLAECLVQLPPASTLLRDSTVVCHVICHSAVTQVLAFLLDNCPKAAITEPLRGSRQTLLITCLATSSIDYSICLEQA